MEALVFVLGKEALRVRMQRGVAMGDAGRPKQRDELTRGVQITGP